MFTAASIAALAVVGGACGGGDAAGRGQPARSADSVTMRLIAFRPGALTVDAGTTVTWRQTDPGAHTVTSGVVEQGTAGVIEHPDGRFDSGDIATGETFAFTFDEPGTFPYFCALHPATMRGEIRVR